MFRSPVTECQRSVFGIIGYNDPLVVAGGQSHLCHAFCRDVVSSRAQGVELREVRRLVPETILVVVDGQGAFHDTLLYTRALPFLTATINLVRSTVSDPSTRPWLSFSRTLRPSSVPEPSCSSSATRPDGPRDTTTCRTSLKRPLECPRKSPRYGFRI